MTMLPGSPRASISILLTRLNREAGANFDLDDFAHLAVWNEVESRIEMHLVSRVAQTVLVACLWPAHCVPAQRDDPYREQL